MAEMDIKTNETEKIELSISTKGIYTWSIKTLGTDINRLEELNNSMKTRFKNEMELIK